MRQRYGITSLLAAALGVVLGGAAAGPACAAEPARLSVPVLRPALDGLFAAFGSHPLVGLGDNHDLANELAFYGAIVRDPRFAAEVGNVVVEFGASQHQDILDRYVAGEDVPYREIAKVWRNTFAWQPYLMGVGYQTFFAQVRAVNLSLPPERRIRVLLGEPPIDWGAVHTRDAWQKVHDQREIHAAGLIVREILERGKKALVIYGNGHFFSYPWPSTVPVPSGGTAILSDIVERTHPDAFYFVTVYAGYQKPECSVALEAEMKWPKEVMIAPVRGTSLEPALMRPECRQEVRGLEKPLPADELARLEHRINEIETGVAGDALIYLAPAAELMRTPSDPTTWMDEDYRKELARRIEVLGAASFPLERLVPLAAAPPRRWTK